MRTPLPTLAAQPEPEAGTEHEAGYQSATGEAIVILVVLFITHGSEIGRLRRSIGDARMAGVQGVVRAAHEGPRLHIVVAV
ncbi:hypothetical protein RB25_04725 [Herbaspirillum rubrisubalbicans]|nr:hypothetical protein RB25_04725 [Herbaspirillum rubrisubalbicans]